MLNGYKTYLVAILTAVLGVLAATDWVSFFNDPKAGWAVLAMSVLMAVMRAITGATTVKEALNTEPPKE
jgi:hypothetical protein